MGIYFRYLLSLFCAFVFELLLGHLSGGAFGRLSAQQGAKMKLSWRRGCAVCTMIAAFREGRPFLQKIASEMPPGGHYNDFEEIVVSF